MPEAEDTQLEIKKRARRRLVGAIALSLFAIIVFPMVMDHDPGPLVQDVEIRIPDQDDRTLNSRLAVPPPDEESPVTPTPSSTPAVNPPVQPPVVTPPQPATPAQAVTSSKPATNTEQATVRVLETSHSRDTKPADKGSDPKTKPAPEKPVEKPGTAAGGFVIQIGAFGSDANVKNLRNKLNELGIKSYTEPFGDKTRVRAGPFPSREAAEKALQKMKSIGVNGPIAAR